MWPLQTAQRVIIVAGCLAMVYTQLTMSPATIEFARSCGATGLEIGILGAVPTSMLFLQFVAAVLVNHLRYRRRLWFWLSIVQRLIFLPFAVGPWLLPELGDTAWLWLLILLTAANHAAMYFASPLWLSWMGDYLPHKGLNRFWGVRESWMQWAAAAALLAGALFLSAGGLEIRPAFAVLVGVAALFGVADILLFVKVDEPAVVSVARPKLSEVLTAPLRDSNFRSFISFTCFWHVAAMIGAPFISYYLLDHVGMDVYRLLLLWTFSWVGGALSARKLGRLAERFGNRPVLILSIAFKSVLMIVLLVVPRDPSVAFWALLPAFMFDAVLNAGTAIASNGFMIKNSPAENRTMFIAAGTALAGIAGGITSVAAGAALAATAAWSASQASAAAITNFHIVFALSVALRLVAAVWAFGVRESQSASTTVVVTHLIGATPIRILQFPVGLYRSYRNGTERRQFPPAATQPVRQERAAGG